MSSDASQAGQERVARGNLIVVSAPSGAGKSTLVHRVLGRVDKLRYSVSYTTRATRGTEREAEDYFFITREEFLAKRERGEFLESAEVHGYLYGTERAVTELWMDKGFDLILDIDVQGAEQVRRQMPDAVTVFILPPSKEALESRLRMRNLNEPADLERRLRNARGEVLRYEQFDYLIVNDDIERASTLLEAVILAERQHPGRQREVAQSIIANFGGDSIHA